MSKTIAILCPSRRPEQLNRLALSIKATSTEVELLTYVDDDQKEVFGRHSFEGLWLRLIHGPRVGLCESLRALTLHCDHRIIGFLSDVCWLTVPGWDRQVVEVFDRFPNDIGVVSLGHPFGRYVDLPFVSRNWCNATGWFCPPGFIHGCWPAVIGALGEATQIQYLRCATGRESAYKRLGSEHGYHDQTCAYQFLVSDFGNTVAKLKEVGKS